MGVWIEMVGLSRLVVLEHVTPFVGVWIEIDLTKIRGNAQEVTPFVGVWIEIMGNKGMKTMLSSHSLRGSVD